MSDTCVTHAEAPAAFECSGCGEKLCEACVEVGSHLLMCRLCGEQVVPLTAEAAANVVPTSRRRLPTRHVVRPGSDGDEHPAAIFLDQVVQHVVAPVAIIAMVAALLFYLVDLRSVFLPRGFILKWIGFCFVVGTVLVARYGKVSANEDRRHVYSFLLAGSTLLVLWIAPWETAGDGPVGSLAGSLIILAVWRFATRLAESLSREGDVEPPSRRRLYGVERLELEAWNKERAAAGEPALKRPKRRGKSSPAGDAHGNPSAAVARLAVLALVLFALGEPFILAGPPEIGVQALAAVVVFLLASGVVLAVGSSVGTLRHARGLGGKVSEALVPGRVVWAGGLLAVILALVLAVPGVTFRGSGELSPERERAGESDASGASDASGDRTAPGETAGSEEISGEGSGDRSGDRASSGRGVTQGFAETAQSFLGIVQFLGKLLWIPAVILGLLGVLVVLRRLAPFLGRTGGAKKGWQALLARLAALLARRRGNGKAGRRATRTVELSLDGLDHLTPAEVVATAYLRLLAAFEGLGHPRPEKTTPLEYVEGLPKHLHRFKEPLARLTALYVRVAYGAEAVGEAERRMAFEALVACKRQKDHPGLSP